VSTTFEWIRGAFEADPVYWSGVATWILGVVLYLYSGFVSVRPKLNTLGSLLCWAGFLATALAHFRPLDTRDAHQFIWPIFDPTRWQSAESLIWLLWILGSALIVASWVRLLSNRAGWLGLLIAMVGVVASWPEQETNRLAIAIGGAAVFLLLLLLSLSRGELRRSAGSPGDYEAELVRLCQGNRRMAKRLIREEMKRLPGLSRAGAALAVVTRMRHEQGPPPSL